MRSKRFVIVYAIAIFLIIFFITLNSVCAITRFEVYYDVGSADMEKSAREMQQTLEDQYLRKSFLFFNESDAIETVARESNGYLEVTSLEKHFPNRIEMTVRERFENFAFERNGKYYVVGDDGKVIAIKDENVNNIAGSNIEIQGISFGEQKVGEVFTVSSGYESAYAALNKLFEELDALGYRGNITKIYYRSLGIVNDPENNKTLFYAQTVEGIGFWIVNPEKDTEQKIKDVLEIYKNMDDLDQIPEEELGQMQTSGSILRMSGYIIAVDSQPVQYSTSTPPMFDTFFPEN